ncbi:hypothetical protein [Asticcacaulis sp. AC402]|uniref:hypothetical protein n=1 Tax=Asticcacaulis sp. AC402 TaxID=1282361 RepID=UPI0003C3DD5D|nr:hypothetical protein [Asticcacaulis sp. AC402]ESQ75147.1 hypothetical protein ABAC402_10790 [Asticcacaulis sp. AC402]
MSLNWVPTLAAIALIMPGAAAAQSQWDYTATLYGWFPGVSSEIVTPVGVVEGEAEFEEILETLDIAFLGAFEARKDRLSLIGDVQYFDIGVETEPPVGLPYSEAEIDSKLALASAYATYAVVDTEDLRLDVGGGLRYLDLSIDTHLAGQGSTPDATFNNEGGWADVLVAARITKAFNDNWYGVAYADVGGFGLGDSSDLTWQVAGSLGYRFDDRWSMIGGYRHMSIERVFGNADVKSEVSGPFLGLQAKF